MIKPLLLATCLLAGCSTDIETSSSDGDFAPNAQVMWIIDGDTIEVDVDGVQTTVRLIGIDTPEKTGGFRPAECYGDTATERMKQLLQPGDGVYLELDREPRDQYDRLLAYVFGPEGLINEMLVRDGYAAAYRYEPNTSRAEQLEDAQDHAQEFDLGLWGQCGGPDVVIESVSLSNLTATRTS
ncbi:MAG: hypothetical protein GY708_07255 [Actinomycetia bacterium]|nr:hypothetical protein [Actinomycetes bacterium]MCP4963323.1 hypothetical protein [Actinomycetes bacterium]